MLIKIICIIFIKSTLSNAIPLSEFNETNLLLSINSQLSELRAEQERQKIDGLDQKSDIQFLRADIQFLRTDFQSLRAELNRQNQDAFISKSDLQNLKDEQKNQLDKELSCQSLRVELERQGKLVDGLFKKPCAETNSSGIYEILIPNFSSELFKVACDAETHGGGWTIILRRMDGSVDFYRNWTEYKNGFGNLNGEFFLGLDKIHALTAEKSQELLVVLEDFERIEVFEHYDKFAIGNEHEQYILYPLGKASGTAGDAISYYNGMKFTTFDHDNDLWQGGNCAIDTIGAWWYKNYQDSQLTGKYNDNTKAKGVKWYAFRGPEYSLKRAVMMIRPKK